MILFLDFDGVLHPAHHVAEAYTFCRLPLLETWLRQRPGLEIVISSSWREVHPFEELRSFFSEDLRSRVLGSTPVIRRDNWEQYDGEPPPVRFERELEVTRWLAQSNAPWRAWAALDDQPGLYKPFNSRVVFCDGRVGLTQRELDRIEAALAGQAKT